MSLFFLCCFVLHEPDSPAVEIENAMVTLVEKCNVSAQEAGRLDLLGVTAGTAVTTGETVGRLNSDIVKNQLSLARLKLESAKRRAQSDISTRLAATVLSVAEDAYQRSLGTFQEVPGSISRTELNQQKLILDQAKLEKEQAAHNQGLARIAVEEKEKELEQAELRVKRREITAPFGGLVVEVFCDLGGWIEPGDPVVRLIRLDRLRVEGFIDGRKFGRSFLGSKAILKVAVQDNENDNERLVKFPGIVTFVSPEIHPVSGRAKILVEIENRELLLQPGLTGRLFLYENKPDAKADKASSE